MAAMMFQQVLDFRLSSTHICNSLDIDIDRGRFHIGVALTDESGVRVMFKQQNLPACTDTRNVRRWTIGGCVSAERGVEDGDDYSAAPCLITATITQAPLALSTPSLTFSPDDRSWQTDRQS